VWVRHLGFKAAPGEAVRYPIGGLTKPFAAVLAMQLAQDGALELDSTVTGGATLRQLLSHTTGQRFIYSSERFRTIQPVLEQAARTSLRDALAARVFRRARLRETIAPPQTTPAGGLESTVEDLARFASALERGSLLSGPSRLDMFRPARAPARQPFPSALGWFVQHVGGEEVRWHFGQHADASSMLLTLPRRRLTLVLLARSPRLSAPFWLQMGDVRWSPAAAAFLAAWARVRMDLAEARRVMMQALVALHAARDAEAKGLVDKALGLAPALGDAPDAALLAAFARSREPDLRTAARRIGKRLLAVDANHPRTLLDLAALASRDGRAAEARTLLEQIVAGGQATPEILTAIQELRKDVERIP
jgi:CubicO group peptidase (beta-lactamase class C family)